MSKIESNDNEMLGKVSIVGKNYLDSKRPLTDGCYSLQKSNINEYILIQYNKNAKYNPHRDVQDICKAKKLFFPKNIKNRYYRTSKELTDNHLKERIFSNSFSTIFIIEKGKIKNAILNIKKFYEKKFWDVDLKSLRDALTTQKKLNMGWYGEHDYRTFQPNFLILNFTSNKNFNFVASNNLVSTENSCTYRGSGDVFGPKYVEIFQCSSFSEKYYKKFEYNFCYDKEVQFNGKQIKYFSTGDPQEIDNYKFGEKIGWKVSFRTKNSINPYKFNYKYSALSKKTRSYLNQVNIPKKNGSGSRRISFHTDGSIKEIRDYFGEEKHGFHIFFYPQTHINPDTFIYDATKDHGNKISKALLYKNGKIVNNPWVIATTTEATLRSDAKEKINNSCRLKDFSDDEIPF